MSGTDPLPFFRLILRIVRWTAVLAVLAGLALVVRGRIVLDREIPEARALAAGASGFEGPADVMYLRSNDSLAAQIARWNRIAAVDSADVRLPGLLETLQETQTRHTAIFRYQAMDSFAQKRRAELLRIGGFMLALLVVLVAGPGFAKRVRASSGRSDNQE
ncbi:MAG: hypothetical protein ACI80V_001434 [Rhodothermales bacterium]